VDGILRHQPEGAELAPGNGQEAAHAVTGTVIEHRVRPGDISGLGRRMVLEQRPDAAPDPQGPGCGEPGHEVLAGLEHLVYLGPGDRPVIGILYCDVGGADDTDRPDGYQDVA